VKQDIYAGIQYTPVFQKFRLLQEKQPAGTSLDVHDLQQSESPREVQLIADSGFGFIYT